MNERPRRSWRRVSLRTLLLLMLGSGCVFGLVGRESRQAQRRAQIREELSKAAGRVEVEYVNFWGRKTSSPPPAWLARVLGEAYFQHVTAVTIDAPERLEDPRVLGELKHLASFEVSPWGARRFTDVHAAGLAPLRRLTSVVLRHAAVTDAGLAHLSPENPLRKLDLSHTLVGDATLAHLAGCATLEELYLTETLVTDEGMACLPRLLRLRWLVLQRVMVSDEGLRRLAPCPNLQGLVLAELPLSGEVFGEIAQFPHLKELLVNTIVHRGEELQSLRTSEGQAMALRRLGGPNVFWAVDRDHSPRNTPYLRWLLERGADPNAKKGGGCAVAILAGRGAWEPVAVLMEFGADVNATDVYGRTPLGMAADRGQLLLIRYLVASGAEVNPAEGSPLPNAVFRRHLDAARLLLELGADVNGVSRFGLPALVAARGDPQIVRVLLDAGADPNLADRDGNTPLHAAANFSNAESTRMLLEAGADPARENRFGETPMMIADKRLALEVVKLLKAHAE